LLYLHKIHFFKVESGLHYDILPNLEIAYGNFFTNLEIAYGIFFTNLEIAYGNFMKKIKRKSKKIFRPKKIYQEIDKYPMVSCEWFDIVSNSNWSSFEEIRKSELATCITKGHLLSQSKGITRIFGDYSLSDDKKKIETIGNTTIIPNSVIKEIKKI